MHGGVGSKLAQLPLLGPQAPGSPIAGHVPEMERAAWPDVLTLPGSCPFLSLFLRACQIWPVPLGTQPLGSLEFQVLLTLWFLSG